MALPTASFPCLLSVLLLCNFSGLFTLLSKKRSNAFSWCFPPGLVLCVTKGLLQDTINSCNEELVAHLTQLRHDAHYSPPATEVTLNKSPNTQGTVPLSS